MCFFFAQDKKSGFWAVLLLWSGILRRKSSLKRPFFGVFSEVFFLDFRRETLWAGDKNRNFIWLPELKRKLTQARGSVSQRLERPVYLCCFISSAWAHSLASGARREAAEVRERAHRYVLLIKHKMGEKPVNTRMNKTWDGWRGSRDLQKRWGEFEGQRKEMPPSGEASPCQTKQEATFPTLESSRNLTCLRESYVGFFNLVDEINWG